ncbi:diacylglycerol/lipid kinase family protein [Aestuariibaculum marinum]|uniref:Diacylglycerol kinase n=1 Tax=Aestuariibaculum marinum TaxID=2683592 RepID=A0A8J6QEB7_9FLAO|nr:diacylglycerol kinase family protein [Aestuariibaculum marinum]MBD0825426.1 diacylglycerol kinase [Aestuariibaculum marinum]
MKLLLVVNPISGGIDKEAFLKNAITICEKYGINYHIFKTSGKADQQKLTDIINTFKPTKVASVGGDGTTLFTCTALLHSNIPMGIIPLGSANGMAEELFVNPKPEEALKDIIMSEVIGHLDMVQVNDNNFSIHIGDVGLNAQIVKGYDKDVNRGITTYAKYFIKELNSIKTFDIKIEANGETINEPGIMLGICNSRKYGTGVPLNANGNPMDGMFEIVLVKKMDVNILAKAGLSIFSDSFIDNENALVISTTEAKITFNQERTLQLDGEIVGAFSTLDIKIIKGAVKFITHSNNPYLKR